MTTGRRRFLTLFMVVIPVLSAECKAACGVQITNMKMPAGAGAMPDCHSVPEAPEEHGTLCCSAGHVVLQKVPDSGPSVDPGVMLLPRDVAAELQPPEEDCSETWFPPPTTSPPEIRTIILRI